MPALNFKLSYSKQWTAIILFLVGLNLAIILSLPAQVWVKLLLLIILFTYGALNLKTQGRWVCLQYRNNGLWQLRDHLNVYEAELSGDSTITRWVSILRFRTLPSGKIKSCVVFQDSLDKQAYRRLMMMVRMG